MSDETTIQNPGATAGNGTNNGGTTTGVTDTTKTGQGEGGSGFDPKSMKDEDFEKVFDDPRLFNHPRFKSLNDQAKEAKALREEKEANERKKLEDEKRFQELAEKNQQDATTWKSKFETSTVNNALILEASKQGVVDPDALIKLIDRSNIKLNDDGTVSGVTEAVKALVEQKPYLTGKGGNGTVRVGGGSSPSEGDTQTPRFKASQLKDVKFYRAHEKEINDAFRLGLIIDDTK